MAGKMMTEFLEKCNAWVAAKVEADKAKAAAVPAAAPAPKAAKVKAAAKE